MEDFRSKSCNDGRMQVESYYYNNPGSNPGGVQDPRCYSASSASYAPQSNGAQMEMADREVKFKKGKSNGGSSSSKSWSFSDPGLQRKKRVASYKAYSVEGKVKGSVRKSVGWLKERYHQVVYGWR